MAKPATTKRRAPRKRAATEDRSASFPSHDAELDSLARIEGQVRGLRKMIEERRYCVDILVQVRSVHSALRRVERNILDSYLRTCVQSAFCGSSTEERDRKIQEILLLFGLEPSR